MTMGWFVLQEDPQAPLKWIKTLEDQSQSPTSNLANICAHYVANNISSTLLEVKDDDKGPETNEAKAAWSVENFDFDVNICSTLSDPTNPGEKIEESDSDSFFSSDTESDDDLPIVVVKKRRLRSDVLLPAEMAQTVFNYCREIDTDVDVLNAFAAPMFAQNQPSTLPLLTLNFSKASKLTDDSLSHYLEANSQTLVNLNIMSCLGLTHKSLHMINKNCPRVKDLIIGVGNHILSPNHTTKCDSNCDMGPVILHGINALQKLVLHSLKTNLYPGRDLCSQLVATHERSLNYLDLSKSEPFPSFRFITRLEVLKTLILYNCHIASTSSGKPEDGFFYNLPKFPKTIRHLDISQPIARLGTNGTFENPNELLGSIIRTLGNLDSLDISGTNLAGTGVAELRVDPDWSDEEDTECCDIPGLNNRIRRPLEYLGLYNTAHDASHRHFIPAKLIGGDKDELQIINAARVFIDREEVLEKILNDLFHLFRSDDGHHVLHCLRLILLAMERHPNEKHIQISGSASLFYIVKNNQNSAPIMELKKRILLAIVTAMESHSNDQTMMRNGCLTICHFKIPQDVMFLYKKLVTILLATLGASSQPTNNEDFVERIAIYLLNSLACQVEGEQKLMVGELGAIQKMLALIRSRVMRPDCDDVMEIAWSTMWNVTDETPENCSKFLNYNGMSLFLQCLHAFPNQPELLRNMMGLLGNVAEVQSLRSHLMTSEFITVFYDLLDSKQDNIEVSYNAAGVLAHILSDGVESWADVESPLREDVCARMAKNIKGWQISAERNINYRSFKPILRLLDVEHTVECRLWAAWALANLTTVYPDKYLELLNSEDGMTYLKDPLASECDDLRNYAHIAVSNLNRYLRDSNQGAPAPADSTCGTC